MNWDLVFNKFNERYPNHELTTVRAPRHNGFAAQSYAKSENGKTLKVYSNPVTGEVQSLENFWNTQRFFRYFIGVFLSYLVKLASYLFHCIQYH